MQLNNSGKPASSRARFWDRMADSYSRRPVADEASYQAKLGMTREYLRPEMDLLELGCGTGSTAIVHAPHVRHIQAVDVSGRMLEIARDKAEKAGVENIEFEQADVDSLKIALGSKDMVLVLSLLHLVEDWRCVIESARDWLKPGGLLVTSTPCMTEMSPLIGLAVAILRPFGMAPSMSRFSKNDLLQAHEDAGFEMVREWQPGKGKSVFTIARKRG